MSADKNKYRSESHRLKNWDYSNPAIYFITFCTKERIYLFGKITEGVILLNENGIIIEKEIKKSIEIRQNMLFHNYVIMPNHIHFLIEITPTDFPNIDINIGLNKNNTIGNIINDNDTHSRAYLRRTPKSISSFVAVFKSVTTKQINDLRNMPNEKIWQNNYHDHIVRNEDSFYRISTYIDNNPINWEKDSLK